MTTARVISSLDLYDEDDKQPLNPLKHSEACDDLHLEKNKTPLLTHAKSMIAIERFGVISADLEVKSIMEGKGNAEFVKLEKKL